MAGGSGMSGRIGSCVVAVIVLVASVTALPGTVSAAAPPPPLTGCLARGSYLLTDRTCFGVAPHTGNQFGPISAVQVMPIERGQPVTLTSTAEIDTTAVTGNCGENGCRQHAVIWRHQWTENIVFASGCGPKDSACTVTWAPPAVGDAAEVYTIVYAEGYFGINPTGASIAYALYTPPIIYPVRLDPVDATGAAVAVPTDFVGYAVAPGANPTQAECLDWEWYWPHRYEATIARPTCVTLRRSYNGFEGSEFYQGYLPADTGRWTIVAGLGGEPGAPLLSRPAGYRRLAVTAADDDIRTAILAERQPTLDVAVIPESQTMDIGATQQVQVVVSAVGGDAGALDQLTFRGAGILTVGDGPAPVLEVIGGSESMPAGGFSVENGASRTFLLDLRAVGLGEGRIDTSVAGRDTLGNHVEAMSGGPIVVEYGTATGEAIPAPVVTSAQDASVAETDPIQGTIDGAPGSSVTVSLASSPAQDADTCLQLMSGELVTAIGSTTVDIGDDGHGAFSMQAALQPGSYVYGIASDGGLVSRVGDCTAVTQDTPTITIGDVTQPEGNARNGTTPFVFTVALSSPSDSVVHVDAHIAGGTATAPRDYVDAGVQTLRFAPGERTQQVTVDVVPDTKEEQDEEFGVVLMDAVHATIPMADDSDRDGIAIGTIVDDDTAAVSDGLDVRGTWTLIQTQPAYPKPYSIVIRTQDPKTGVLSGTFHGWSAKGATAAALTGRLRGTKISFSPKGGPKAGLGGKVVVKGGKLTSVLSSDAGGVRVVFKATLTDPR